MKLTPTQARDKIRQELDKGNGAYINSRFYNVRVSAGILQVSYDFKTWADVAPGSEFRTYWGTAMFTYEPETTGKHLTVVWANGLVNDKWQEAFEVGNDHEITRETTTQYIISPLGFDIRINKSTLLAKGFRTGYGIRFEVTEVSQSVEVGV